MQAKLHLVNEPVCDYNKQGLKAQSWMGGCLDAMISFLKLFCGVCVMMEKEVYNLVSHPMTAEDKHQPPQKKPTKANTGGFV